MDKKTLIQLHNIAENMILGNMELAYKELGVIIKKENEKLSNKYTLVDHCEKCLEFDVCWKDDNHQIDCKRYTF